MCVGNEVLFLTSSVKLAGFRILHAKGPIFLCNINQHNVLLKVML